MSEWFRLVLHSPIQSKVSMVGSNHGYAPCLNDFYKSLDLSLQKATVYLIPANEVFEVSHHR